MPTPLSAAILLLNFSAIFSGVAFAADKPAPVPVKDFGITEKLGDPVSVDRWEFKDEAGKTVRLSDYMDSKKPLIIAPMYYGCPSLCGYLTQGMIDVLNQIKWTPGKDFEVVTFSIDPKEKSDLAKLKKDSVFEEYKRPEAREGWHFLTGDEKQIQGLTQELGFKFAYDERVREYAHGSGLFVLMPSGKLSRVLHGIQFRPMDFKLAVMEASSEKIGSIVDRMIMYCYRYDPNRRTYSLVAMRLVQTASALVVLMMLTAGLFLWRRS